MQIVRHALLLFLLTALAAPAKSAPDEEVPIPRVEAGTHTGFIYKLSVDKAGKYLLTVGDDKTARLWDVNSGQLLHTFRIPIANGHEGQLYAAALSPNGKSAAVAGFTGSDIQKSTVYFFDTDTGRLQFFLSEGLPDAAVDNLAFSTDGGVLAICLAAGRGVHIYDTRKRRLIRSEPVSAYRILGAAFSKNGDFAMSTYDGTLSILRASNGYLPESIKLKGGTKPEHVQFSPDGNELVVGFDGAPAFSIVDPAILEEIYTSRLGDEAAQRGLHVAEWSADGQSIYAGGESTSGSPTFLYRFPDRGRGRPQKILSAERRFADARRLPDGAIAFATTQPEVGVIEPNGRARWRIKAPVLDLAHMSERFEASRAGDSVVFGDDENLGFEFNVLKPPDQALIRQKVPARKPAESDPAGWEIGIKDDGEHVTIGGKAAVFEDGERLRARAFTPDGDSVIFGTAWSLRCFDRNARQRWYVELSAAVSLVRITADGRSVIAGLSDGTVRWYRVEDGQEFLALFVHKSGQDWIAWIPSGYYISSPAGDNFIGWHINRRSPNPQTRREPEFYRASQFERVLYRPDIVRAAFQSLGRSAGVMSSPALEAMLPARIELAATQINGKAHLRIAGKSHKLLMQDWSIFVNGIPVIAGQPLDGVDQTQFSREVDVVLSSGVNQLHAEAMSAGAGASSLGFADTYVLAAAELPAVAARKLFVLSVGVSKFKDHSIPGLNYAADDASEVAATFARLAARTGYSDVRTRVLLNDDATLANVSGALREFLANPTVDDSIIVFMASHGMSDKLGNYYFVPHDATREDIRRLDAHATDAPSLLKWEMLVDQLRRTAGHRLLVIDTCSSGALGDTFDAHSLAKRSMSSNFAFMAATGSREQSQELAEAKHGLFTYGLLQALQRGYDPDGDGAVSLAEAFQFAYNLVQERRNPLKGPQTPQLSAPPVLADMKLASTSAPSAGAGLQRRQRLAASVRRTVLQR